jgi:alpha-L-fucosidase
MKQTLILCLLLAYRLFAQETKPPALMLPDQTETPRMKTWINYRYGMFIHYGMNTFVGTQQVPKPPPATTYSPPPIDVDAWIKLAKDAGMKYAVLTTKHSGGFCLWDSKALWHGKEFDYDVAASGNKTDVVKAFVNACKKYGIAPGFYYCLSDTYANQSAPIPKLFSVGLMPDDAFELAKAQLAELATNYPDCRYFWLDTPQTATAAQQAVFYDLLRRKNPENVVLMNTHYAAHAKTGDQSLLEKKMNRAYPSDFLNTESKQQPEGIVSKTQQWQGKTLFMGYEHCDMAGHGWFNSGAPKPGDELFQLYQTIRQADGNLLLDVGPSRDGVIAPAYREALLQLKERIDTYEKSGAAASK